MYKSCERRQKLRGFRAVVDALGGTANARPNVVSTKSLDDMAFLGDIKYDHRDVILLAERDSCLIHDAQAEPLDGFVRQSLV